jgi:hypothetical protein
VAGIASECIVGGGHAAFVVDSSDDIDRLLDVAGGRWPTVSVVALPARQPLIYAYAPLSGRTTPELVRSYALEHARVVARDAACALPADVAGYHLVHESWRAPSFLARLREGAFDVALFAAWPPRIHRSAVFRAARAGGTAVVRVPLRQPRVTGLVSLFRHWKGANDEGDRRLRPV